MGQRSFVELFDIKDHSGATPISHKMRKELQTLAYWKTINHYYVCCWWSDEVNILSLNIELLHQIQRYLRFFPRGSNITHIANVVTCPSTDTTHMFHEINRQYQDNTWHLFITWFIITARGVVNRWIVPKFLVRFFIGITHLKNSESNKKSYGSRAIPKSIKLCNLWLEEMKQTAKADWFLV